MTGADAGVVAVPANEASWADLQTVFGRRGAAVPCQCQRYKLEALARAAVDFARSRGARVVEGYPMTTTNAILEELHVGTRDIFADAGFVEVSRPTLRRAVMRVEC